jgi:hypothetical protein
MMTDAEYRRSRELVADQLLQHLAEASSLTLTREQVETSAGWLRAPARLPRGRRRGARDERDDVILTDYTSMMAETGGGWPPRRGWKAVALDALAQLHHLDVRHVRRIVNRWERPFAELIERDDALVNADMNSGPNS